MSGSLVSPLPQFDLAEFLGLRRRSSESPAADAQTPGATSNSSEVDAFAFDEPTQVAQPPPSFARGVYGAYAYASPPVRSVRSDSGLGVRSGGSGLATIALTPADDVETHRVSVPTRRPTSNSPTLEKFAFFTKLFKSV